MSKGLGPRSWRWLAEVGIDSAQALNRSDPFEIYARLRALDARVSINLLYGMIGAIEGRDWREVARTDRTSILLRLDDMGLA